MADIFAVTGAVTTATRLARELEKKGCVRVRVVHTPAEIGTGGCSYSVRMPENCIALLLAVSSSKRFRIKKIYRERTENGEKIYDDIS